MENTNNELTIKKLDEALEKASRLNELLQEGTVLINSLLGKKEKDITKTITLKIGDHVIATQEIL